MFEAAAEAWTAWWVTVPPSFAFLLMLPVIVVLAGWLGDVLHRRRSKDRRPPARPKHMAAPGPTRKG